MSPRYYQLSGFFFASSELCHLAATLIASQTLISSLAPMSKAAMYGERSTVPTTQLKWKSLL